MITLPVAVVVVLLAQSPFASERISVVAGDGTDPRLVDEVARACGEIEGALGPPRRDKRVVVRVARDLESFTRLTDRPPFEAAALVDDTLWLVPDGTRGRLFRMDEVFRHECVHAWLAAEGLSPLPRTLEEAAALTFSGQAARLPPAAPLTPRDAESAEATLARPRDRTAAESVLARVAVTYSACLLRERARLGPFLAESARSARPHVVLVAEGAPCAAPRGAPTALEVSTGPPSSTTPAP